MAVKIRLARHGKKNYAYYHIVVADSRAPRDGRFIELIGSYNPNTNPATIILDNDKALQWIKNGAQPTDTCKKILSYKGVMLKKHLLDGVKKGALTLEQAEAKFNAWVLEKENKVSNKKAGLAKGKADAKVAALEAEAKVNAARAEELAKKKAEAAAAEAAAKAAEEAANVEEEATIAEATAEGAESFEAPAEAPAQA